MLNCLCLILLLDTLVLNVVSQSPSSLYLAQRIEHTLQALHDCFLN